MSFLTGFFSWRRSELVHLLAAKTVANPVFMVEMRRWMRGSRPVLLITSYLLLLFVVVATVVGGMSAQRYFSGGQPVLAHIGERVVNALFMLQLGALFLVTPAMTATAIPREREHRTFGFLRTTLLSPGDIVTGKVLAAVAFNLILMLVALPFYSVVFLTGGLSPLQLAVGAGGLFLLSALLAALGVTIGIEMRRSVPAFIAAYVIIGICAFPAMSLVYVLERMQRMARMSGAYAGSTSVNELLIVFALFTVITSAFFFLFLALGRERLAGWYERGSMFRLALLLFAVLIPVAILGTTMVLHPVSAFSAMPSRMTFYSLPSAIRGPLGGCFGLALFAPLLWLVLFGTRPPHPVQANQPLLRAWLDGLRPRNLRREDPLNFPLYNVILLVAGLAVIVPFILYWGALSALGLLLLFFVYGLVQVLFWGGLAQALALWLAPRRLLNLGTVLIAALIALVTISPGLLLMLFDRTGSSAWLKDTVFAPEVWSPLGFIFTYCLDDFNEALRFDGDFLFHYFVGLNLYLFASVIPWLAAVFGWRFRRRTGLELPDEDA